MWVAATTLDSISVKDGTFWFIWGEVNNSANYFPVIYLINLMVLYLPPNLPEHLLLQ